MIIIIIIYFKLLSTSKLIESTYEKEMFRLITVTRTDSMPWVVMDNVVFWRCRNKNQCKARARYQFFVILHAKTATRKRPRHNGRAKMAYA